MINGPKTAIIQLDKTDQITLIKQLKLIKQLT